MFKVPLRSKGSSIPLQHEVLLECKDGMRGTLREKVLTDSKLTVLFKIRDCQPSTCINPQMCVPCLLLWVP